MQASDVKHRQKSSNKQQNGEKRRSEDEKKKKESIDVKLCVSLLCLALSVLITWLHLQQSATLAEMRGKHESLQEKSRGVEQLGEKLTQVSRQLQASAALLSTLGSVLNTSAALQAEQDASSRRLHALHLRLQSGSDRPAVSDELHLLKTQSRAAHGRVTEHVNDIDGRLRQLSERLQEVQDGTRRNTRVLDRTEEEDAQRVREQTDWNARRVSRLQEQLEQLAAQGLQEKLESLAPHAQDEQLAAAEEAVRSMLRVRAHVSATLRRVQELELQVRSAEDRMRESRSLIHALGPASREDYP